MTHWRDLQDDRKNPGLYAEHLQGADRVLRISAIRAGQLVGEKGRKTRKPMICFEGVDLPLAANVTNCKMIAKILGTAVIEEWVGRWITLYPTTTTMDGETYECIRVRPKLPTPPKDGKGGAAQVREITLDELTAAIDACGSAADLERWWKTKVPRQDAVREDVWAAMVEHFKARRRALKTDAPAEPGSNG